MTAGEFARVMAGSGSVFGNGPMGVFERESFSAGTKQVARALVDHHRVYGRRRGRLVAALRQMGLEDAPSHLSTGGGADWNCRRANICPV